MAEKFKKRNFLQEIEKESQKKWQDEKVFDVDAPEDGDQETYFATFPYPYMNGPIHLGHTFAFTKAEFQTRFQRTLGKRVLFPFGFHGTGMPIKASADKLTQELAEFGNPPKFPDAPHFGKECMSYAELANRQYVYKQTVEQLTKEFNEKQDAACKEAQKAGKKGTKKSKAVQKTGAASRVWDILLASNVDVSDIPKFVDPFYWLEYFPSKWSTALRNFGASVDLRRSFITTDANPYYDAFIRWQFKRLKDAGKLKFGKRHSIYSPKDGQTCADHDRASGEGVGPQEYTLIKMRVLEPAPKALEKYVKKNLFLAAATLRPETMYGQTNCYVLPTGTYGVYDIGNDELFVIGENAARNLAFQGHSPKHGEVKLLAKVKGTDLIGTALSAPLATYERIYVHPLFSVSMTKGTGVVTSVPSDAPDDWAMLRELQAKQPLREKFGLTDEQVMPFKPVPIIKTTEFGELSAVKACDDFKVNSPNDRQQLDAAKDKVYKAGFYDGVFLVGDFKGEKVESAKTKVRQQLVDQNLALEYFEPASPVRSRSGDDCVVCLTDQWYIDYAQPEWKEQVKAHVETMDTFGEEMKLLLLQQVDRLHEWGCSRSFGLGTKLPCDEQYVIESLSDSTIYMAYYTIAHLLQGGNTSPSKVVVGPAGVKPEQVTDEFFDYVFHGKGDKTKLGIDVKVIDQMRREFTYWYPWNLRTSGRDLAYNHLPFSLFNHVAIFEQKYWPKGIKCCAFLEVDGEKMSKSRGNFLTTEDAVARFSADGARIGLADSGDFLDVANFDQTVANGAVLKLYTWIDSVEEVLKMKDTALPAIDDANTSFADRAFENVQRSIIADVKEMYEKMLYRDVLKRGFYEYFTQRERYLMAAGDQANKAVLLLSHQRQAQLLAPIAPHTMERVWTMTGGQGLVVNALYPDVPAADPVALLSYEHLHDSLGVFRKKLDDYLNPRARKGKKVEPPSPPKKVTIKVCLSYPAWQEMVLDIARSKFNTETKSFDKDIIADLRNNEELQKILPPKKGKKRSNDDVFRRCQEPRGRSWRTRVAI